VPAPVCLIVNPAAGGGKAGRVAPEVEQTLQGYGLRVRRVDTRDLAHAREIGLQAARAGETVVALSGDGMLGVLADAVQAVPSAVLGVVPGGRGNDLARVLGIPADPVAACATVAHGLPRPIDLGAVTAARSEDSPQAFVGIASAGFDSDCNRVANEAPPWLGGLVYAYSAVRVLLSWKPARFEIELDPPGQRYTFRGYSIVAANSKAYGGGMRIAPDALLDDGLLDIVASEHVGKLRFLANLPKVFKGAHVRLPSVHVFRAAEVEISADRPFTMYADGDPIGELPVRVRAVRGAVKVLVPAAGEADSAFTKSSPLPRPPVAGGEPEAPASSAGEPPATERRSGS
jgi:YegS/Rv2252/BmrU family lipid kinase